LPSCCPRGELSSSSSRSWKYELARSTSSAGVEAQPRRTGRLDLTRVGAQPIWSWQSELARSTSPAGIAAGPRPRASELDLFGRGGSTSPAPELNLAGWRAQPRQADGLPPACLLTTLSHTAASRRGGRQDLLAALLACSSKRKQSLLVQEEAEPARRCGHLLVGRLPARRCTQKVGSATSSYY
jgi:hypothetical protein